MELAAKLNVNGGNADALWWIGHACPATVYGPLELELSGKHLSSRALVGILMAGDRSYPAFEALFGTLRRADRAMDIAVRFAEGRHERLQGLACDLLSLRPDVIVAVGAVSFYAIRALAPTVPTVFVVVVDPDTAGIGPEAWPGARVAGVTSFDPEQAIRQVRLLRRALPELSDLAILGDADVPPLLANIMCAAVIAEGLRPHLRLLRGPEEIGPAVAELRAGGVQALVALEVPRTSTYGCQIVEAATDVDLPTLFGRDMARACPLIACGTSFASAARRAADQVVAFLAGTEISALSIECHNAFEVVLNLNTAGRLGLVLPGEIATLATKVVRTAVSQ